MTGVRIMTSSSVESWKSSRKSDYQAGIKVDVAMSAQIISVKSGATVWSNSVSEVGTVSQRTVPGVVSEMNRTLDLAINKLLSTVPAPLSTER